VEPIDDELVVESGDPKGSAEAVELLSSLPEAAGARLREHFTGRGQPAYRAGQVLSWLHERDAMEFSEMTNLPAGERAALAEAFQLAAPELVRTERSNDGTIKHLWRLTDGELVESVLIPAAAGRMTLCISSQAGCAMACTFCATGWSGYRRQLTAGEIVSQFRGSRRALREAGRGEISNVVFMGMGEPLMNRGPVMDALTLLNGPDGMGARRITVSTVGIVPGILELAARPEQFRLAVSLHAPNTELRRKIVPIERKYPLPKLLGALREFEAAGGRRITFEYVMIQGINDTLSLAQELAGVVGEFQSHVNLIPYNPIPGNDWKPSSPMRLQEFAAILEAQRIPVTVRTPRGRDIAAACGQLAAEHTLRPPKPFLELQGPRRSAGAP
jgi:23S rRNA (adenine2503-C2)-methyltransferase